MSAVGNQRWRAGRDSYRPAGETIRSAEYDVEPLDELPAKAFVLAHHYSGTFPAARFRFALRRRGALVGVAVFSHPCSEKVLTSVFPGEAVSSVELGRFVLLDEVPGNGKTWFLARCFEALKREGLRGVVSFSDPEPRKSAAGLTVFPGHVGTIYQAHNAVYLGRATPRTLRLLADGTVFSARATSKIRAKERGWVYACEQLIAAGAPEPGADLAAWLRLWLPRVTRTMRHGGNHRYAWPLRRDVARSLATTQAYPKRVAA